MRESLECFCFTVTTLWMIFTFIRLSHFLSRLCIPKKARAWGERGAQPGNTFGIGFEHVSGCDRPPLLRRLGALEWPANEG